MRMSQYSVTINESNLSFSITKDGERLPFENMTNVSWGIQTMLSAILRTESEIIRREGMKNMEEFDLSLDHLTNNIKSAIESDAKYIGVLVSLPNCTKPEIIINSRENFIQKLNYYKAAYDNSLSMKNGSGVKIVGFSLGNSFTELENDLME